MAGKLYTSYFANLDNIPKSYKVYSVVRKPLDLPNIICFAPSKSLLYQYKSGNLTFMEFSILYTKELVSNPASVETMNTIINTLNQGDNIVFVCYEKSCKYCHRKILAEVFSKLDVDYQGEL